MEQKEIKLSSVVEPIWAAILVIVCSVALFAAGNSNPDVNLELVPAASVIVADK